VTPAVLPDRATRPGGRWSTPILVDDLLRLATLERATAHLAMGWVPKVPDLDDKLALAATVEDTMVRAAGLRHQALSLLARDEAAMTASPDWLEPIRALETTNDAVDVVDGIIGGAHPFLRDRYRDLAAQLDRLYDARLLAILRPAIDALGREAETTGERAATDAAARLRAALEANWSSAPADDVPRVPLEEIAWAPLDRVPVPARPAVRPRPEPGSNGHLREMSRLEDDDLASELNDNVMAELSAMELLCRCSYEHPELDWTSHLALARHVADEERHASIFRRLLAEHGFDEASLHQHGANYEYAYEFPECETGGPQELVWRLLIMCTVLEALAIDKLPVEIGARDTVGQVEFARALDYISIDELFHTENGLRLTRRLCAELGLDPMLNRELVHGRFFGRQHNVRSAYLEADPERAAREITILDGPDPDGLDFASRTEIDLRRRASFSDDECLQVERWGYNPRAHPALQTLRPAISDLVEPPTR